MLKKHYINQTPLYEANYSKLVRLIPSTLQGITLRDANICDANKSISLSSISLSSNAPIKFVLEISECHRYTIVAELTISYNVASPLVSNPTFKLHICHDAKVAEVVGYHQHTRFKPDYEYPNQCMLHRDEKHQVNRLLSEFLDYFVNDKRITPLELLDQLP